jgi:SulP family sulfate permease
MLYEIAGPLFFGAAEKAMDALHATAAEVGVVVLDLGAVPVIDATGMVNLESALARLTNARILVILVRVQPQPASFMARVDIVPDPLRYLFAGSLEEGMSLARAHLARSS